MTPRCAALLLLTAAACSNAHEGAEGSTATRPSPARSAPGDAAPSPPAATAPANTTQAAPAAPAPPIVPPPPSLATLGGDSCTVTALPDLAQGRSQFDPLVVSHGHGVTLVGWQGSERVLVLRLDADGAPVGEPVDVGLPPSGLWPDRHRATSGFWLEPVPEGFLVMTLERHVAPRRGPFRLHVRALDARGTPTGEPLTVPASHATFTAMPLGHDARGLLTFRPDPTVLERYSIVNGSVRREELASFEHANPVAVADSADGPVALLAPRGVGPTRYELPAEIWFAGSTRRVPALAPDSERQLTVQAPFYPSFVTSAVFHDGALEALVVDPHARRVRTVHVRRDGTLDEPTAALADRVVPRLSLRPATEEEPSFGDVVLLRRRSDGTELPEVVVGHAMFVFWRELGWDGQRLLAAWGKRASGEAPYALAAAFVSCSP